MLGAIVGDIVGSRFEFLNRKSKEFEFFHSNCHVTDDSIMTIAVGEALMAFRENGGDLREHTVASMRKWGRKYINAGYGGKFIEWLLCENPCPYGSCGNGAGMRVSMAKTYAEALEFARAVTDVTHDHPEAVKAAETIAALIFFAWHGVSKWQMKDYVEEHYCKIDFTLDEIREGYEFDVSCLGSVPQAIAAFLESKSFVDTIRNAVSLGGDSDTIAAIAGSIAEAHYGIYDETRVRALEYLDADQKSALLACEEKLFVAHVTGGFESYDCHGNLIAWVDDECAADLGIKIPSITELTSRSQCIGLIAGSDGRAAVG